VTDLEKMKKLFDDIGLIYNTREVKTDVICIILESKNENLNSWRNIFILFNEDGSLLKVR